MASRKSILIIGAGIGGLSAGCYARMSGYGVRIVEMHDRPGGVCTGWRRGDYLFDGCIHNLGGTDPGSRLHKMWHELGVVPRLRTHGFREQVVIERAGGEPLVLHSDLDRLERHLEALAPGDRHLTSRLIADARFFAGFDLMGLALASPTERARAFARMLPIALRYRTATLQSFAQRFRHPFLRAAFPHLVYDWPNQSVLMLLYFLGRISIGDLGWIEGGSAALAGAVADRFAGLGGVIKYGARVETVLIEDERAIGVRLADGQEERGDTVISNGEGRTAIEELLGGRYGSARQRAFYGRPEDRVEMGLHISFGVAMNMSGEAHAMVLPLETPLEIAGESRDRLFVQIFNHGDRAFAPPGKTIVQVLMATSFARWQALSLDPELYRAAKAEAATEVAAALDARFPGFAGAIEAQDVATPVTTLRFAGSGHGYKESMTNMMSLVFRGRRPGRELPGLSDFYQVGQWAGVPGLPFVAADGRDLIRTICRRDGRPFTADVTAPAASGQPSLEPA